MLSRSLSMQISSSS